MSRSLLAVLVGTFTLRFSTGLTGLLLVYYFSDLPDRGGPSVDAVLVGLFGALFYATELVLSTPFGLLSDHRGHHRVMQFGPVFGMVAVVVTFLTGALFAAGLVGLALVVLALTRLLEGASTAASVPSILGFIADVTAGDELLRGRAAARFEGATLAGLGSGLVVAGVIYQGVAEIHLPGLGPLAFLVNAVVYGVSLAIFRFGVEPTAHERPNGRAVGLSRYATILTSSHVLLLAPTWIAINAALGIFTSQSVFALVDEPNPRFADQLLMGGFDPAQISLGLVAGGVVFFAGLAFWGERFKRLRRTTIIAYGIAGGGLIAAAVGLLNHSQAVPGALRLALGLGVIAGLFVLAGATPAAVGLLADVTEAYPDDRGAVMGLYSVFLALGQIGGNLFGGVAADARGIDGLVIATLILLAVALVPLNRLRSFEHIVGSGAEGQIELTEGRGL